MREKIQDPLRTSTDFGRVPAFLQHPAFAPGTWLPDAVGGFGVQEGQSGIVFVKHYTAAFVAHAETAPEMAVHPAPGFRGVNFVFIGVFTQVRVGRELGTVVWPGAST